MVNGRWGDALRSVLFCGARIPPIREITDTKPYPADLEIQKKVGLRVVLYEAYKKRNTLHTDVTNSITKVSTSVPSTQTKAFQRIETTSSAGLVEISECVL